jgi:uncharacterized protein (DUF2062 family)
MKWKFEWTCVDPETLALTVAVGALMGVFPMYGCPTLLCTAAALALRLNMPAVQLINLLASPLQLALAVPFARLGERIVPLRASLHAHGWQLAWGILAAVLHAVAGWACAAVPIALVLYCAAVCGLRRRRLASA